MAIATLRNRLGKLGAAEWRVAKEPAKAVAVQLRQPFQSGVHQLRTYGQLGISADRRPPVPGADILADVASENLPAQMRAQLLRNGAALFDREIGNAEARVHLVGGDQRSGRTRIEAARATAATVGRHLERAGMRAAQGRSKSRPERTMSPIC